MRAILTYHSIDESNSAISLSAETFRAHVAFLASGMVRVVPLRELPDLPDELDAVALTFDDAFQNFEAIVLPGLLEHGLSATLFVVADHVGGMNDWPGSRQAGVPRLKLMNWNSLCRAAEQGIEIGAHGRRHYDLTMLTTDVLEEEVAGCAMRLTSELGARPVSFAYPYGRVNESVVTAVGNHFDRACTTEFRPLARAEHRSRLPRLDAYYFRRVGQLERWGSPAFRRRLWLRAQGRRVRGLVQTPGAVR
jgi:peptidoglycan/xylan/chitin deacetylase (PgdA/CDA1 family)